MVTIKPVIQQFYKLPRKPEKAVFYKDMHYGFIGEYLVRSSLPFKEVSVETPEEDKDIDTFLNYLQDSTTTIGYIELEDIAKKFTHLEKDEMTVITCDKFKILSIKLKKSIGEIFYANSDRIPPFTERDRKVKSRGTVPIGSEDEDRLSSEEEF